MQEVDFYPEVCYKFCKYLKSVLPEGSTIAFSSNKVLPKMVNDIETELKCKSILSSYYIPILKLDIVFGVKIPDKPLRLILLEVKYSDSLTLVNYSQLVGYLQVAKNINIGILFLVDKGNSINILSNDFSNILMTKNLPMTWELMIGSNVSHRFNSGLCYYQPNGKIEWQNTTDLGGISSFKELFETL